MKKCTVSLSEEDLRLLAELRAQSDRPVSRSALLAEGLRLLHRKRLGAPQRPPQGRMEP